MAKVELYIQDQLCDLIGSESINVDYTNFDITKIDSRGGARSYSFKLPKTNRNKSVLDTPEMVPSLSSIPYTRMKCRMYVDGVDMLIRLCELQSTKDTYNVQLYGANSDIFIGLKDLKLQDLDFSEYDHFWNFGNVINGLYRTDGYGYGILDYHTGGPNAFIDTDFIYADFMLPFVYVNKILEKIFANSSYTFINEIQADTSNMVVPYTKGQPIRNLDTKRYEAKFSLDMIPVDGSDFINVIGIPPNSAPVDLFFNILDSTNGNYFTTGASISDINYYFCDAFEMDIEFNLILENTDGFFPQQITIICNYSQLNTNQTLQFTLLVPVGITTVTHTERISINPISIQPQSLTYLNFTAFAGAHEVVNVKNGSTIEFKNVKIVNPFNINYEESSVFDKYDYLTVSSMLPEMTQMEFLKNYMQMFCLLPIVNEVFNTVTLIRFDKLLENTPNAYDWSDKLDTTEDSELKFIQTSYAQKNKFSYKQDGDEQKPQGTDGVININNSNLEFEKDAVELIYAGTQMPFYCGDMFICQIGIFQDGEYANEKEPRILNLKRGLNSLVHVRDTLGNLFDVQADVNVPYFIDYTQRFNLGFSDNLIPHYYNLLKAILGRVKILNQYVRLNASDISSLDFSRPVWIAKYESYFYINAVKGYTYTESKSTLVELVKMNING